MSATPPPQQTPPVSSSPSRRPSNEGSIIETLESILIAFVLAFVFRAFIVEAFVIPTGSMAPTLLGQHIQATCPQCGYSFAMDPRDSQWVRGSEMQMALPFQGVPGKKGPLRITCPMCDYPMQFRTLRTRAGDRILVLKYIYAFPKLHEPQRWDVVVFKNPEGPEVNYIKRLVGLPGEQLWIVGGNIYTRPLSADGNPVAGTPWQIQRKPDRVQRAVWQPIYHSDYYPLDGGESPERNGVWTDPWQPVERSGWTFDVQRRTWAWSEGHSVGELNFDFDRHPIYAKHLYAYNEFRLDGMMGGETPQDMRLAATIEPTDRAEGAKLEMATAYLLIRGVFTADGEAWIETAPAQQQGSPNIQWTRRTEPVAASIPAGAATRVELWHVDQAVSLWVDNRKIAKWDYTLADVGRTVEGASKTPLFTTNPMVRVDVDGPAKVHGVDLDRDLYYTHRTEPTALATEVPVDIEKDRFFCLGDNSPESKDGRLWTEVDPWLEHQTGVPRGFVPRDMMIGRAFFVYYPAPRPLTRLGMAFIPNFGQMRMIH